MANKNRNTIQEMEWLDDNGVKCEEIRGVTPSGDEWFMIKEDGRPVQYTYKDMSIFLDYDPYFSSTKPSSEEEWIGGKRVYLRVYNDVYCKQKRR